MPDLRELHPELTPYAQYIVDLAEANSLSPVVTSVYRSTEKQARLYERYLKGLSPFPAAPPGRSLHEHRLAFDMDLPGARQYLRALGRVWESFGKGFRWGGSFKPPDIVHFEYRP